MTTSAAIERRELAQRTGNGIEVTLLWTKATNAYAATRRVRSTQATQLAPLR